MAKVTMQDIADALGISRVTVWKIFNNSPGVSEALKIQTFQKAAEMGYLKVSGESATKPTEQERTVSVIVSRPESSTFWLNIIHHIAKTLTNYHINLMYTYLPSAYTEGYTLPQILKTSSVQGIVVLNVYDHKLLELINDLEVPKIFLDTVPELSSYRLNGDLVLLEGRYITKQITTSILQKGRSNIGFIGDIQYAQTNYDRYLGFLDALEENQIALNPENCYTKSIGIYTYYEELSLFLQNLPKLPEAFVCASDYIAHYLEQYFSANNIRIPQDIALSGFDGSKEYTNVADFLTTAFVDTSSLGNRLASQILYRMDNPNTMKEVIYIKPDMKFGNSTNF